MEGWIRHPSIPPRSILHSSIFRSSILLFLLAVAAVAAVASALPATAPDLSAYPWLYLRGGVPLASGEEVVEVIAVGDVMLGRGVAQEAQPLAAVRPWLRAADLAVGNLECTIAAGGTSRPGPYRLLAPLSAPAALRGAGFDVLGLANNHALDYDPAGLEETVSSLEEAGLSPVGSGPDVEAASQPLIREVGGVRLAFLALNDVPDPDDRPGDEGWTRAAWDPARAAAAVAHARAEADAVIVSVHWGYEYELRPDPAQRDAARILLEAGADLVVGHHPHVVQGVQTGSRGLMEASGARDDGFVAYSLGNFVFDQEQGETRQGLALRAFFDGQGLRAVQALPVWAGTRPRLMTPEEAAPLLARIQPAARRVGFACDGQTCHPTDVPQTPQAAPFRSGAIDLTGDGTPEQVRLEGEQVAVYEGNSQVWQGRPPWRVVDLALGDPNDDGRAEILLALLQPDGAGALHSQPFLAGYRRGGYRVLWGGSAVADPIHEVEVGDVDGDGIQELVVLEEQGRDLAVSVWRWHGWGFTLVWRSPPGRYRDLALVSYAPDKPPILSVAVEP
jgi:hypothetical protein